MLLTFSFELLAAIWIAWRYKLDRTAWMIIAVLVMLAIFQLAEWQVCANSGAQLWARVGFVATALLVPMGTQLTQTFSPDKPGARLNAVTWWLAIFFSAWFLLIPGSVEFIWCGGNYSIYKLATFLGYPYFAYYFVFLTLTLLQIRSRVKQTKSASSRRALTGLGIGMASFMIPTLLVNIAHPDMVRAMPSVLCGFAVILACFLVGVVAPAVLKPRR